MTLPIEFGTWLALKAESLYLLIKSIYEKKAVLLYSDNNFYNL